MATTLIFFAGLLVCAWMWALGKLVGRRCSKGSAEVFMLAGCASMLAWGLLMRRPAVAVQVMPVDWLVYAEGIGAAPAFFFIIGILAARSSERPHRSRLAALAAFLALVYFVSGGFWMLQRTPLEQLDHRVSRGMVLQSQNFTCVPAACATALNLQGIYTSESEMAELTHTRMGTGATLFRAMSAINQRLMHSPKPVRVELLEAATDELTALPAPMVTPLSVNLTRRHMVAVLGVDRTAVWIADPEQGIRVMDRADFDEAYTGSVLVFRHESDG